jgi:hypothetical protein
MQDETIPLGLCQCGCGEKTNIAKRTNACYGHVKGQPVRFIVGHANRGVRVALSDRFWPKVQKAQPSDLSPNGWAGCWLWTASLNKAGYGQVNVGDTPRLAHRVSYEMNIGEIPSGLVIDHLCRRPSCVNPAHLEPVTHAVNCRRGIKSKLTLDQVIEARRLRTAGETMASIAERFGVSGQSIDAVVKHRAWSDDAC